MVQENKWEIHSAPETDGPKVNNKLRQFVQTNRQTLLGVGPVSQNCVDASIELANEYKIPLMLIASRRQIDSADFGGGYVNNWTTESFCQYVRKKDRGSYICLARDHGGPWQSELEVSKKMSLPEAMESSKKSFLSDMKSGMEIIHLDPGRNLPNSVHASVGEFVERTKELLLFCHHEAVSRNKPVVFEIGTDEGKVGSAPFEEIKEMVNILLEFCKSEKITSPGFIVLQTGTKVMEMRNVGSLDSAINKHGDVHNAAELKRIIDYCKGFGLLIKEHNADYLSDQALAWHANSGIDSANVAPEFGVIETKAFLHLLSGQGLSDLHDKVVELAFNSGKWKKWMLENSTATDYDKASIAGHYIFCHPEFIEIKKTAEEALKINIDDYLKNEVKKAIYRYLYNFNLISQARSLEAHVFNEELVNA